MQNTSLISLHCSLVGLISSQLVIALFLLNENHKSSGRKSSFIPLFSKSTLHECDTNADDMLTSTDGKSCLDEIGNVHRHLLNLSAVELLDLSHHSDVVGGDEVDRDTLSSKSSTTTDSVDVVLSVGRQVVVDD